MARESVQHKLERTRPPRVKITYEVESGGSLRQRELPFVVGVMGDFVGSGERPIYGRTFRAIDFDSFDAVMAAVGPRVRVSIPGAEELRFLAMEDFEPEGLLRQSPGLDAATIDRIFHTPAFQKVEAAWRGLWYFLSQTETSSQMLVKLLDTTKGEVLKDLQRATQPDQSRVFKLMYEEPYGEHEVLPFGLFVCNFEFGASAADMELLEKLGAIASACHAPLIAAPAPELFGLDAFFSLDLVRDLSKVFESAEHVRWQAFRQSEDARYVGLALPRILLRVPHGTRPEAPGDYEHREAIRGPEDLLWGNAAFAFGACVANAFSRYGWCGAIRGVDGGGMVEGLPTWIDQTDAAEPSRSGVEAMISDRREKELSDLGFLPLVQVRNSDRAVFFSVASCAEPKRYQSDDANENSRLSCQLPYVLTASRFMHFFKVLVRDKIGSYITRAELETMLNRWAASYVNVDDEVSTSIRARYPLREARVDVVEDAASPGSYRVVAFIRPYFQLDGLSVSLRLVGNVP